MTQTSYDLHVCLFWICAIVVVVVCMVLLLALWHLRKTAPAGVNYFHKHIATDMLWATIPIIMLILLALPSMYLLFAIAPLSSV